MGFERPSQQHNLVLVTIGVTIAFGAAAVAGQVVFRSRFGPAAGAAANDASTHAAATTAAATSDTAIINDQRLALAAGRLSDGSTTQAIKASATETAQLVAMNIPTTEQMKQGIQDAAADATAKAQQAATAAAQEKWDEVKANTAAAALEAATTAGAAVGDKLASAPIISDLNSPEAQAVGVASVSLWQSLWQVFVSIWQAIVGLVKK